MEYDPHIGFNKEDLSSRSLWVMSMGLHVLESTKGVQFIESESGSHFIKISSDIPYPRTRLSEQGSSLFLPLAERSGSGVLLLPDNSTTLINILNEAAGTTGSFFIQPDQSRTLSLFESLFASTATALAYLANEDGLLPDALDYRRLLVSKDENAIKFLPPIDMVSTTDRKTTLAHWKSISESLVGSIMRGAETAMQAELARAVAEIIDTSFERVREEYL